ncbi:M20/M25/M40 family metallo-hydrolase [Sporosarcina cyprini]|uniref:M20/M25/M40 family metallo-hydrolase n=1 Tax=Sporosarcina cyprini TaxID=2910523 RepID=UPI001EE126FC|nr:M20/M25/M40 family metallo-hydrolase [Sporosarcina cyprini]MCG3088229.1 M20/M25/M40 family metallo-hydrolase [Sporosarcina cyprini]
MELTERGTLEQVYRYIDEHKETYLKWLFELCEIPSVAAQSRGIDEAVEAVKNKLLELDAEVQVIKTPGNPVVFGSLATPRTTQTLSFYNHYDVQPEDPLDIWESPPFSPTIRDGKIFCRGVADNKGTLMARLCAVHAYKQVLGELPVNLKFIVEGEEEIGSPNLETFADEHIDLIRADANIWENGFKDIDGNLQVSLGCKGMLYVELHAHGANTDLHSGRAAIVENPAWRLVWALATLKNEKDEILIDGFYDKIRPMTDAERKLTEQMEYNEEEDLKQLGIPRYINGLTGFDLQEKLIFQPTCTICGIESGYTGEGSKTVLPCVAKVKLDFRLVSDQDPDEILELLRTHLDKHGFEDIEIVPLKGTRAATTALEDPLVSKIEKSAMDFYGKPPKVLRSQAGTGPMYSFCQKFGIPSAGFGVGHADSRNHAPNESIFVDDYIEGIKFMAMFLHQYAEEETS